MVTYSLDTYNQKDLKEIVRLYKETIQAVNQKDYSYQQIKQWLNSTPSDEQWHDILCSEHTLIARQQTKILGFGSLSASGSIDYLFVDKSWIGYGIGKVLADALITQANSTGAHHLSVHASITAKPFFESLGFTVFEPKNNYRNGVLLLNYVMVLPLDNKKVTLI